LRLSILAFLLALAAHGLLFLALWWCPTFSERTSANSTDTRVVVELCKLDLGSSSNHDEPVPIAESMGPNVALAPAFNPVLKEPSPIGSEPTPAANNATSSPGATAGSPSGYGPGSLFPLPNKAVRAVYVLDRSVSMGEGDRLEIARSELIASLQRLPARSCFQVIAYNNYAETLVIDNNVCFLAADQTTIEKVALELKKLAPSGGTDHAKALRRGLNLRPDVLYFVTDADDLSLELVDNLTKSNACVAIHTIELTNRRNPRPDGSLARLARCTGGTYRCVPLGD
jgi:hypothetical protein